MKDLNIRKQTYNERDAEFKAEINRIAERVIAAEHARKREEARGRGGHVNKDRVVNEVLAVLGQYLDDRKETR